MSVPFKIFILGAVGHMQGRYANHTWDGDTNGKNSASWYSSWQVKNYTFASILCLLFTV